MSLLKLLVLLVISRGAVVHLLWGGRKTFSIYVQTIVKTQIGGAIILEQNHFQPKPT